MAQSPLILLPRRVASFLCANITKGLGTVKTPWWPLFFYLSLLTCRTEINQSTPIFPEATSCGRTTFLQEAEQGSCQVFLLFTGPNGVYTDDNIFLSQPPAIKAETLERRAVDGEDRVKGLPFWKTQCSVCGHTFSTANTPPFPLEARTLGVLSWHRGHCSMPRTGAHWWKMSPNHLAPWENGNFSVQVTSVNWNHEC
jgi:hypothetical protein